jgi:nucleotide-binding universal stress UspA family protein
MATALKSIPMLIPRVPSSTAEAPILIASDGRPQSDAAIIAAKLAARDACGIRAVMVLEPMPIVAPEVQFIHVAEIEATRRETLVGELDAQLHRVAGVDTSWPFEVRVGDPALEIAHAAAEHKAKLIITGLGRHRVLDRVFGDETAIHLLRIARVPVLAVPADFAVLPTRIIAAIDFSDASVRAMWEAIALAGEGAHLYLIHAIPREVTGAVWESWAKEYRADVETRLAAMRREIEHKGGMSVETMVVEGDPAHEVLAFAKTIGADLIATGSHGHGYISRMLLGSVSTKILRGAHCAVLGVPHRPEPVKEGPAGRVDGPVLGQDVLHVPVHQWSLKLGEFTKRNAGRRGNLEVDDPEIGAQAQIRDYPLLGATYDHNDARVELMFGELGYDGRHFTRSIGDIRSVDIVQDANGRDAALRIAHGAGQSLLVFHR